MTAYSDASWQRRPDLCKSLRTSVGTRDGKQDVDEIRQGEKGAIATKGKGGGNTSQVGCKIGTGREHQIIKGKASSMLLVQ